MGTGGGGIRTPLTHLNTLLHNADINATEIVQSLTITDTYENFQHIDFEQKLTLSEHSSDTILHQKCVICVSQELREIIDKWDRLPKGIKESIILLVKSATT
jgi:hypothetical protein